MKKQQIVCDVIETSNGRYRGMVEIWKGKVLISRDVTFLERVSKLDAYSDALRAKQELLSI